MKVLALVLLELENPDTENFDLEVESARIYNHINKSSIRLAINLAEQSLK